MRDKNLNSDWYWKMKMFNKVIWVNSLLAFLTIEEKMRLIIALLFTFLICVFASPRSWAGDQRTELKQFKECDVCSEMVVLPSGVFWMGASEDDVRLIEKADSSLLGNLLNRSTISRETPRHQVKVKSFAIAKYPITVEQFSIFARETKFEGKGCNALHPNGQNRDDEADWHNPWFKQSNNEPVVCVSWNDAQKYILWLNSKFPESHAKYRLPTEAEWEYAARAGTTTPAYWGDASQQCKFANAGDRATKSVDFSGYNTNASIADCDDGFATTSPVGAFPPNPWGLYDMLGNAKQWINECGLTNYTSGHLSTNCARRTERGAAWSMVPSSVRAASRFDAPATLRSMGLGFRLAIDVN